jgi:hypothetical protein
LTDPIESDRPNAKNFRLVVSKFPGSRSRFGVSRDSVTRGFGGRVASQPSTDVYAVCRSRATVREPGNFDSAPSRRRKISPGSCFFTGRARASVFPAHRHARARIARHLPRAPPDEFSSGVVMSGPVSCHLPVDASLHSFNSLDYGFGAGESPFLAGSADATCGVAAVRAVSQYLNLEPMRAGVSFADTPGQLAQPAPSEALVARERDAARGDRPWEEQQLGVDALTASGRTGAAEDVSTSHDVAEVRLGLFRTSDTRGAPSIRGFLGHATARAAFSGDKHLTATLRFPPRHDRRIPQAFPPLNFGDLDVEQQADALFSKVRLPSGLPSPRSPRTPRRTTLAPPHVASFSERANTSLRLSIDKKNTPLTPFSRRLARRAPPRRESGTDAHALRAHVRDASR